MLRTLAIVISGICVVILLVAAVGYFVLPPVLESRAAAQFEEMTGYPVKVELEVPFNFVYTGRIEKVRLYAPTVQVDGLTVRQVQLELSDMDISVWQALHGSTYLAAVPESSGTCIITEKDFNQYLASLGNDFQIIIDGPDVFVQSYEEGIGRLLVQGRLEVRDDVLYFEPEALVEPKMLSLLFKPDMWKATAFGLSLAPASEVLTFDKVVVRDGHIVLYFHVKEDALAF